MESSQSISSVDALGQGKFVERNWQVPSGRQANMVVEVLWTRHRQSSAKQTCEDFEMVEQVSEKRTETDMDIVHDAVEDMVATMYYETSTFFPLPMPARPVSFRVLLMGHAPSQRTRKIVQKKLAEGIVAATDDDQQRRLSFREKKYNVAFLDIFRAGPIEPYEDSNLYVIEADFTWNAPGAADSVSSVSSSSSSLTVSDDRLKAYITHHYPVLKAELSSDHSLDSTAVYTAHKGIDMVLYFYSAYSATAALEAQLEQDLSTLSLLSQQVGVPVWPLLTTTTRHQQRRSSLSSSGPLRALSPTSSSSRARMIENESSSVADMTATLRQDLLRRLADHNIRLVDITGINPEQPHFIRQHVNTLHEVMTVSQFEAINKEDLCPILWRLRGNGAIQHSSQEEEKEEEVVRSGVWLNDDKRRWITVAGLIAVATSLISLLLLHNLLRKLQEHLLTENEESNDVQVYLNPEWGVPDEYTLRHLFIVDFVSGSDKKLWDKEDITVRLYSPSMKLYQRDYKMGYVPDTRFTYVADVPSPCFLGLDTDIQAAVIWNRKDGNSDEEERYNKTTIAHATLALDTCQYVLDESERDEPMCPVPVYGKTWTFRGLKWQLLNLWRDANGRLADLGSRLWSMIHK